MEAHCNRAGRTAGELTASYCAVFGFIYAADPTATENSHPCTVCSGYTDQIKELQRQIGELGRDKDRADQMTDLLRPQAQKNMQAQHLQQSEELRKENEKLKTRVQFQADLVNGLLQKEEDFVALCRR